MGRPVRVFIVTLMAVAAAVSGCAAKKPPGDVKNGNGTVACDAEIINRRLFAGEDMQTYFTVKANSQWCFDAYGWSNRSAQGSRVATAPAHGQLRLQLDESAIVYGYRPDPGFVGIDHFRIGTPGDRDAIYRAATVTVEP